MTKKERKEAFARALREARGVAGWSQPEAAERIGVPATTYKAWERKISFPQTKFRPAIIKAYGLPEDFFSKLESGRSPELEGFEERLERTLSDMRSDLSLILRLVSPDGYDADQLRRATKVLDALGDPASQPKR